MNWYKKAQKMFETFGLTDKLVNSFQKHYIKWMRQHNNPNTIQKIFEKNKQIDLGAVNLGSALKPIFKKHGYPQGIKGDIPKRIQFIILHPSHKHGQNKNAFFLVLPPNNDFIIAKVEPNINSIQFDYEFSRSINHELQHFLKSLYEGKVAPEYAQKSKQNIPVSDTEYFSEPWEIQTFSLQFASDAVNLIEEGLKTRLEGKTNDQKQNILNNFSNSEKYVNLAIINAQKYLKDLNLPEEVRKKYMVATFSNFNKLFNNMITKFKNETKQTKIAQIRGEWWIINGQAIFADNNIGEMGHEAYVLESVRKEIADTMDYSVEEIYNWDNTKQEIIQHLVQENKIDSERLIKKYGEDYINEIPYDSDIFDSIAKKFNISQEQLDIADGSGDVREYGMKNLRWKRMAGNNIETQTLTSADLKDIMDGVYDAYDEEAENSKFNIEIRSNGKVFWDIPWQVMEEGIMAISQYGARGLIPTYAKNMSWYKLSQQKELNLGIPTEKDLEYEYFDAEREAIDEVLSEFKISKPNTTQPWTLVPFDRVKRIWEDYMRMGFVRDVRGMESIAQTMIKNVHRLAANTYLMGHTESDPLYDFKEHKINKKQRERFYYDYAIDDNKGQARISDYGLKPLQELAFQLQKTFKPEKQLQIVDRMFNIAHQRSDLPSFFIEGGTNSLNQLFGRPSDIKANNKSWYKLAEQIYRDNLAKQIYRGDSQPINIDDYDLEYARKQGKELGSSSAYGPGIYFVTAKDIAEMYGNNITKKQLNNANILTTNSPKINKKQINEILNSIDPSTLETAISNWDEDFNIGKQMLMNSIMSENNPIDQLMSIWADVFNHQQPYGFINTMIQNKIDGISLTKDDATYYVIYNKDVLT